MTRRIYKSIHDPIRENLTWNEKWDQEDKGLIFCWETGRREQLTDRNLAARAQCGQLPIMGFKGGIAKKLKQKKHGTLYYLAEWYGLRGEDLDIDMDQEITLTCTRTDMPVTFTGDRKKW